MVYGSMAFTLLQEHVCWSMQCAFHTWPWSIFDFGYFSRFLMGRVRAMWSRSIINGPGPSVKVKSKRKKERNKQTKACIFTSRNKIRPLPNSEVDCKWLSCTSPHFSREDFSLITNKNKSGQLVNFTWNWWYLLKISLS